MGQRLFEHDASRCRLGALRNSSDCGAGRARAAMRFGAVSALAIGWLLPAVASAEEPRSEKEPRVLREPTEITQVVDAFDEDDPFDLHFTLGYQQTWKSATIQRETTITQAELSSGGYTASNLNVAQYSQTTARLNTRADIGLYQDIALVIRLPIILSDDRKLEGLEGSDAIQSIALQGAPGEQLFRLPFESPTRSGIEYLALGLDFGIFNQYRDPSKPTWVVGFEGRFNVSEPMHACNKNPQPLNQNNQQVDCAESSDINRNGVGQEFTDTFAGQTVDLEGNFNGGRSAGVSRGTTGLEMHTYVSKRIGYIEPYAGLAALFEFQNESSDYGETDLKGSLVNHPPLEGRLIAGLSVMPWEVREQFQRVTVDFRFTGRYRSEGRDYSELFDALGSSDAPSLRYPKFAEYQANPDTATAGNTPSVVNPGSQKVYTTGITDVQQHGIYTISTTFTWQAGEYVKFNLGGGYTIVQGHSITFDQPCNPDFSNSVERSGPCRSRTQSGSTNSQVTGIPNPNYRAVVNAPGRRFRVADSSAFDAWVGATVMF